MEKTLRIHSTLVGSYAEHFGVATDLEGVVTWSEEARIIPLPDEGKLVKLRVSKHQHNYFIVGKADSEPIRVAEQYGCENAFCLLNYSF